MTQTLPIRQKIRRFAAILGPIVVTQVALSGMNFVDTMMSGRYAAVDLAGVAIGASLWLPLHTGLSGILGALTPIVAQHAGAGRKEAIPSAAIQGVYLAVALAALVTLAGALALDPILGLMDLENDVRHVARHYLIGLSWGILPLFAYSVMRSLIDAHGQTRITMVITLTTLPINVLFNYALIFGKWGFPQLGGVGAGYATAITCWLIALMALGVVVKVRPFAGYRLLKRRERPSWTAWKEQLRIGVPIGVAIFLEVGIFSAVALLMSQFGTVVIAAHQAAISFSTLLYMLPLSISMALTIAVGFEVGARRIKDAIQYSYLGISTSLTIAVMVAFGLVMWGDWVARMYTSDPDVLSLTRAFLGYAVFFQLSDAVAAPIQGTLRGYKDVNVILILSIASYWLVGLPAGYILANYTALGPFGYWIGLITALAVGAFGLSLRLRATQRAYLGIAAAKMPARLALTGASSRSGGPRS